MLLRLGIHMHEHIMHAHMSRPIPPHSLSILTSHQKQNPAKTQKSKSLLQRSQATKSPQPKGMATATA